MKSNFKERVRPLPHRSNPDGEGCTAAKMKITSDLHIHTNLSSCASREATLDAYIERALPLHLKTLGFSNHLWDSAVPGASNWYAPQNVEHVLKLKEELNGRHEINGIRILFGCETEFTYEGKLCLAEENFHHFEYILVPHSHTHMKCVMPQEYAADHARHAKFLMDSFLAVVNHPLSAHFTSIAHPFVPGTKYSIYNEVQSFIPDSYFYEAFSAAKEKGIAIEVNGSCIVYQPEEQIPRCEYVRIYTIAKKCGCTFTYGSDSHDYRDDRKLRLVENFLDICGITEDDFLKI